MKAIHHSVGVFGFLLLQGVLFTLQSSDLFMATDMRPIRDMVYFNGSLWCASEGGLLKFDFERKSFEGWTKVDGLGGVGIRALSNDESGLWLLFDNRLVQRWVPGVGVTHTIATLAKESGIASVNFILVDTLRRVAFVATNRGLAKLAYLSRYDRWIWEEEYRRFGVGGWIDPGVRSVVLREDTLWIATEFGIAKGYIGAVLINAQSWTIFTTLHGLPSNDVIALTIFQDTLWAATSGGTVQWDGNVWRRVSSRTNILRLYSTSSRLWAVARDGLLYWDMEWRRWGPLKSFLSSAVILENDKPIVGAVRNDISPGGVAMWEEEGWRHYLPSGPITNFARQIAVTQGGDVLLVGGRGGGEFGLSRWDGRSWKNYAPPQDTGFFYRYFTYAVTEDTRGGIWVGSFMGGVAWFRGDTTLFFNHFSATGSRLIGYGSSSPEIDLVLAPALTSDLDGNIWILNRGAADGRVLVCVPYDFLNNPSPDREWYYFHRNAFGNYPHFDVISVDGLGRKWIASTDPTAIAGRGVYVLDDRRTPEDPSDDRIWGPIGGLGSPQVFDLTYDPAGYMWAGSIDGAYYAFTESSDLTNVTFSSVYPLRNISVNAIAVDPVGNKWFGTEFGILVLGPDLFTVVQTIGAEPQEPLPHPKVNTIGIEPLTGRVWVGTEEGTVVMRTPYREFGPRMAGLTLEPNPFNPLRSLLRFTGSSLAGGGEALILTFGGDVVRRLSHYEAAWGWDGKDSRGEWVSDGIYLVVVYNPQGEVARAKVAVVKK